ncbi:MAG: Spy/CpxP family protein refolding chaperone [Gemmatimonadota bacterium]
MRRSIRRALVPVAGLAALVLLAGPAAAQEDAAPAPDRGDPHQHQMRQMQGMQGMKGMQGHAAMRGGRGMLGGMSDADKQSLKAGEGLGAGRLAMMNGYPGPKHVLEMGDELALTDAQKESIGTIFAEAKAGFAKMGAELVQREEALEAMFASGSVDVDEMEELAAEIGELQGRLRAAHLAAHVRTKAALTAEQLEKLPSMAAAHGAMGQGEQHRHGMQQGHADCPMGENCPRRQAAPASKEQAAPTPQS